MRTETKPEPDDDDINPEVEQRRLEAACTLLEEHFDSVQIFCTKYHHQSGTRSHNYGAGNWYTRRGQVKEWVIKEDHRARCKAEKEEKEEDDTE